MKKLYYLGIIALMVFSSCQNCEHNKKKMDKPVARKEAKELVTHGDKRVDDYFWMRLSDEQKEAETPDLQTQEVVDYLNAENAYTEQVMEHTNQLQGKLYDEIVGRIQQTDQSVPVRKNGYWYYSKYEEGLDYAFSCRKKDVEAATEEIMLDQNKMAEGLVYFAVGGQSVSPDNKLLVYGVDTISRREYTLFVKNLETGDLLRDELKNTTGGATWANDNKTLFYTMKDPVTLRSNKVFKHVLGTDQSSDEMVYEETDETFNCFVYKTKSDKYLMIGSSQTLSSEYRFLDANEPNGEWKILQPRQKDFLYRVSHFNNDFYITTNWDAKNFRLMKTPVSKTTKDNWTEVIAHRNDVLLEGIDIFKKYLVVSEMENGLSELRIINWETNKEYYMEFNDPAYMAYTSSNPEFNTEILRYGYTSLTTPNSTFDFNMTTREQELLKQQEIMDPNFSPDNYQSERVMVEVRDGVKVPVSMVYRKGMERTGKNPLLLYAYGSYVVVQILILAL